MEWWTEAADSLLRGLLRGTAVPNQGISGARGRDKRPQFDWMLRNAVRGKFDILAAWAVDRLGRSLQDLVATLGELRAAGIDLFLHQQAVDTTTPSGRAMFQMLGVFAEFERAMIQERVKAGLARARAAGKTLGRSSACWQPKPNRRCLPSAAGVAREELFDEWVSPVSRRQSGELQGSASKLRVPTRPPVDRGRAEDIAGPADFRCTGVTKAARKSFDPANRIRGHISCVHIRGHSLATLALVTNRLSRGGRV